MDNSYVKYQIIFIRERINNLRRGIILIRMSYIFFIAAILFISQSIYYHLGNNIINGIAIGAHLSSLLFVFTQGEMSMIDYKNAKSEERNLSNIDKGTAI